MRCVCRWLCKNLPCFPSNEQQFNSMSIWIHRSWGVCRFIFSVISIIPKFRSCVFFVLSFFKLGNDFCLVWRREFVQSCFLNYKEIIIQYTEKEAKETKITIKMLKSFSALLKRTTQNMEHDLTLHIFKCYLNCIHLLYSLKFAKTLFNEIMIWKKKKLFKEWIVSCLIQFKCLLIH